jgi:omega-6 fatty acid desaturase (delta-12 desaturase)
MAYNLPTVSHPQNSNIARAEATELVHELTALCAPNNARGIFEILVTVIPLLGLWTVMWMTIQHSIWLTLLLSVPAAGFLTRLFMIQHDCGHGSFFSSKAANDWTGRIIGVLTLTPYGYWRRTHALHHAGSGNLERRGFGDLNTITVSEYCNASKWQRLKYRLYRHPLVLFVFGPAYLFILQHRLPLGLMNRGWQPWISTMGTNVGILICAGSLSYVLGLETFLFLYIPVMLLAATLGVWLFFVQHQFEETVWDTSTAWNWHEAALHGSSHYDLPLVLRWFTANIGMHHVHHLCGRIPFYNLPCALQKFPELVNVGRLTLLDSLGCIRLALWDESARRLVGFCDIGIEKNSAA